MAIRRFLISSSVGLAFFALPIAVGDRITVPFDLFFSSVAPMMLDMFREIPVRLWELVVLFLLRTALLVPHLASATALFQWMGFL